MGCQKAILPTCLNYKTGWRTAIFHNPYLIKCLSREIRAWRHAVEEHRDICLLKSRRCSRRGARGQREWEAQEAIMRKQALGGSNARTWRGEEGPQKNQQPPHKSSSVLTKQKNKTTCTHTHSVHSTPLKCIITTPPDHQSLGKQKKKLKIKN